MKSPKRYNDNDLKALSSVPDGKRKAIGAVNRDKKKARRAPAQLKRGWNLQLEKNNFRHTCLSNSKKMGDIKEESKHDDESKDVKLSKQLARLTDSYKASIANMKEINSTVETRSGKKEEIGVITFSPDDNVVPKKSDSGNNDGSAMTVNTKNLEGLVAKAVSSAMEAHSLEEPWFSEVELQSQSVLNLQLFSLDSLPTINLGDIFNSDEALEQFVDPFKREDEEISFNEQKSEVDLSNLKRKNPKKRDLAAFSEV